MHILITGANGYIGKNLSEYLRKQGHKVSAMTRKPIKAPHNFEKTLIHELTSEEPLPSLEGFDAIVHLAGWVHKDDSFEKHQSINRDGTIRIAQKAAQDGVRRFIFMSTVAVNGHQSTVPFNSQSTPQPVTYYGRSKWEAEQGIKEFDLDWVMLRPPMVYGHGAPGNFQIVEKLVQRNLPVPFAAVEEKRNFIYIENLCAFIDLCLTSDKAIKETFLVCDGPSMSVGDFFNLAYEVAGKKTKNFYLPLPLLKLLSRGVGKESLLNKLTSACELDYEELQTKMNWTPPWTTKEGLHYTFSPPLQPTDNLIELKPIRRSVEKKVGVSLSSEAPAFNDNQALKYDQPYIMRKMDQEFKVSIIIPCLNEAKHISRVLDSVLLQSYPSHLTEIIVVDGMSTDNTSEVLESYQKKDDRIKIFKNEKKITPH
ncbi:MAG: NAD-dependent epimerase/dehydratase family protein, partial [Bdellovibrionales bacterium]|nr:NAD-dependent epimerase/dehydratase family protein [Bdellovibrionales bacterium]